MANSMVVGICDMEDSITKTVFEPLVYFVLSEVPQALSSDASESAGDQGLAGWLWSLT